MNNYNLMLSKAVVFAVLSLFAAAAHAAQSDEPSRSLAQSAVAEAARARLEQGGSLAEQIARAKGKSEDVTARMRERAASLVSSMAGRNAQQLRAMLPGNVQVSGVEGKPCDVMMVDTPGAGAGMCKPGEH